MAPLAVSFALALVPVARADDAVALYDPAAVARIALTLTPEAIAALTRCSSATRRSRASGCGGAR